MGQLPSVLGGLAHESDGQSPADVALRVDELAEVVTPLLDTPVTVIVGFTERDPSGDLFSSTVLSGGRVAAVCRKVYPGYRTVIRAGTELPVYLHGSTPFENTTTVVVADIAGRQGSRLAHGFSAIVDLDGTVLARAEPLSEALLVAEVEPTRYPHQCTRLGRHHQPHRHPPVPQPLEWIP